MNILSVGQGLGCRVSPSSAIQSKHLRTSCRNLLHAVTFQPLLVLLSLLNGCIGAWPLAPKHRRETYVSSLKILEPSLYR